MKNLFESWRKFVKEEATPEEEEQNMSLPDRGKKKELSGPCIANTRCSCVDSSETNLSVRDVQNILHQNGYSEYLTQTFSSGEASGECNEETRNAIMAFQKSTSIQCDACVGDETHGKMLSLGFTNTELDAVPHGGSASQKSQNQSLPAEPIDDSFSASGVFKRLRPYRDGELKYILIHESGMNSYRGLVSLLASKGYGVHYVVQKGRGAIQTSDLNHPLIHCPGFNRNSIGVEFNHAYHGKKNLVRAPWFWKKKYNIPETSHLESLYQLVNEICSKTGIPFELGMVRGGQFHFGPREGAGLNSGVLSHRSASGNHGDGNYQCLYMALRQRGFSPSSSGELCKSLTDGISYQSIVDLPSSSQVS